MFRVFFIVTLCMSSLYASSQIYVLKDHRDSTGERELFDSLPIMVDSFWSKLRFMESKIMKNFTPTFAHLKAAFDTLGVEYNQADLLIKQQLIEKKMTRKLHKSLKKAKKNKVKFKRFSKEKTNYNYGISKEGYEFCYVTIACKKKKTELNVKFLAMKLDGQWFIGDELSIYWLYL